MDAVTYPDPRVVDLVHKELVATRINISSDRAFALRYQVNATPTLLVLDGDGAERNRSVGYLPPEQLIPYLLLGLGKAHYFNGRFRKALAALQRLVTEFPQSAAAQEADNLKRACEKRAS